MKDKTPIYYWDTCVFLAWIQGEKREPAEMSGLNDIVTKINRSEAKIITSALTTAEILRSTLSQDAIKKWENFFKRRNSLNEKGNICSIKYLPVRWVPSSLLSIEALLPVIRTFFPSSCNLLANLSHIGMFCISSK